MKNVCVLGLGYIGLPTSSLLASSGFKVTGVDVIPAVVDTINRGEVHIVEPDLAGLVKLVTQTGALTAATTPKRADVFIIAVPTPFKADYQPDLKCVLSATDSIAPYLERGNLVILESTSPVGTTEQIAKRLRELRPELFHTFSSESDSVFIAYCPERVLPGRILQELVSNDRVVGGVTPEATEKAAAFYSEFVKGEVVKTNARTAELVKLSENSFRDVNIAFANELSMICSDLDINVWELIEIANRHPRVNILQPGPGVGGHCIAVDPWFIVSAAPKRAQLIRTARNVNDSKPHYVVDQITNAIKGIEKPVIACLGLAFKADVDDMRESPAIEIVRELATKNIGHIVAVDPYINEHSDVFDTSLCIDVTSDYLAAVPKSDVIVLLVNHKEFRNITPSSLKEKVIIDTRGMWR